jgi:C-terminal processing protease CtpA/Prc
MDAWASFRCVATAVASIRCAHTAVSMPESLQHDLDTTIPILPLAVRVLDRHLYVLRDLTQPPVGDLAGDEIVSVAGIPTARLLDTLYAALPRDGDVASSDAWRIDGLRLGTHLARVFSLRSPFTLELRERGGRTRSVAIEGRPRPALVDSLRARFPGDLPPANALDTGFLDGGAVARIALHRFSERDSATLVALHRAVAQAFDSVRTRHSRALILDLRGNGGGEDELGLALVSALLSRSFTYYDSLVINPREFSFAAYVQNQDPIPPGFTVPRPNGKLAGIQHPNQGTHEPAPNHFDGPLFVLMDGRSLSTTCEFLSNLEPRRKATYVGEEAGGAYGGNTSGFTATVRLPNSGLRLFVPQMTYYMAAHGRPLRRGMLPDVAVQPTIDDLLAGRDPAMTRAVELARRAAR